MERSGVMSAFLVIAQIGQIRTEAPVRSEAKKIR
jgi:hypothetical protein